jgi:hypothetical protein
VVVAVAGPARGAGAVELDTDGGGGTALRWTLLLDEPLPATGTLQHYRKRLNVLINANLRYSLGQ